MHLPPDMATLRGAAFLDALAAFADHWAQFYHGAPENDVTAQWVEAFGALHNMALSLKLSQENHIARMKTFRAEGKRVFSETDLSVDAAIGAARSAFIKAAP